MRGKALSRFLSVILALGASVPAVALASVGVSVKPGRGRPSTRFVVRFTAPDSSGHIGALNREYMVNAYGPAGARHCLDSADVSPARVRAHTRVRVTLDPATSHGKWCTGKWSGTVDELESPVCRPREICPAFVALVRRLGHFRFTVRPRRVG
jgi:hypothetical protein